MFGMFSCLLQALMIYGCSAIRFPAFAGPYTLDIKNIEPCDNITTSGTYKWDGRVIPFNRHKPQEMKKLFGNVTLLKAFDDTASSEVKFAIRSNNEWKQNAFLIKFPTSCTTGRIAFPGLFKDLLKDHVPKMGTCVVPAGVYTINTPVDVNIPTVRIFPYGQYLGSINIRRRDSKMSDFCQQGEVHFNPRTSS